MAYRTRLHELKLKEQVKRGKAMTWQQIAREIGIAYSTIQRYANEAVPQPDYSVLDRLAEYFGVSIPDLVYRDPDKLDTQELNQVEVDDQGQLVPARAW